MCLLIIYNSSTGWLKLVQRRAAKAANELNLIPLYVRILGGIGVEMGLAVVLQHAATVEHVRVCTQGWWKADVKCHESRLLRITPGTLDGAWLSELLPADDAWFSELLPVDYDTLLSELLPADDDTWLSELLPADDAWLSELLPADDAWLSELLPADDTHTDAYLWLW